MTSIIRGSDNFDSNPSTIFGGQSWQNVITTPGRAMGTTYTNSTSKPIEVAIGYGMSSGGGTVNVSINGGTAFAFGGGVNNGGGTYNAGDTITIPPGATYNITFGVIAGSMSLNSWWELR